VKLGYEIILQDEGLTIQYDDGKINHYTLQPLPEKFLTWQSTSRIKMFETIRDKGVNSMKFLSAHLPVLSTFCKGDSFANLSSKGLGLLPVKSKIDEFINLFRETKESFAKSSSNESILNRMEAVLKFYANIENFNPFLLGGLEIFEGKTAENIQKNPHASLLFTGSAPTFFSLQLNGIIDIIQNDNPYYQFLLAARELFASDAFHIKQIKYPFGYLFYIVNLREKTPFTRKHP
jgi:hypothetical protein